MTPLSQLAKSLRLVRKKLYEVCNLLYFWIVAAVSDVPNFYFRVWFEKDLHFECKNSKLQIFFKPDSKIEVGDIRDSGDDPEI